MCMLFGETKINGIADIIDSGDAVWEIKCTKSEDPVHFLQLAVYMYMHAVSTQNSSECKGYLYYVLTDVLYYVESTLDKLKELITELIVLKTKGVSSMTDEEFTLQAQMAEKPTKLHSKSEALSTV